jgi:hypothetical protein
MSQPPATQALPAIKTPTATQTQPNIFSAIAPEQKHSKPSTLSRESLDTINLILQYADSPVVLFRLLTANGRIRNLDQSGVSLTDIADFMTVVLSPFRYGEQRRWLIVKIALDTIAIPRLLPENDVVKGFTRQLNSRPCDAEKLISVLVNTDAIDMRLKTPELLVIAKDLDGTGLSLVDWALWKYETTDDKDEQKKLSKSIGKMLSAGVERSVASLHRHIGEIIPLRHLNLKELDVAGVIFELISTTRLDIARSFMRLLGAEETMMTAIVRLDDAAKPPAPASHPLLPLVLNFICDDITAEQTLLVKALHICIQRKKPLGAAVVLDHPAIMTAPMAVLEPEALAAKEGGMRDLSGLIRKICVFSNFIKLLPDSKAYFLLPHRSLSVAFQDFCRHRAFHQIDID